MGTKLEDYDYFVPHQPNGKFPLKLAKTLGLPKEKIMPSLLVTEIGTEVEATFRKIRESGKGGIIHYGYKCKPKIDN